ncbi:MAG: hypothetical protein JSW27_00810 [Phycisphaerales bacterium]|nr:MAG: hypothetical protein JSW27_00810 [Phycisphaerales bacterium]
MSAVGQYDHAATDGNCGDYVFLQRDADTATWGEKRNEAMELIELACQRHPDVTTAEALVPLVYRLKQGIGV